MKTDAQLRNEVNDELKREAFSDASNIEVDVTNAVVTLFGTVHSDAQKAGAESAALRVPGVMSLASDLMVFRDPMPLGSDRELPPADRVSSEGPPTLPGR